MKHVIVSSGGRLRAALALLAMLVFLGTGDATTGAGSTFVVNSTADSPDALPGNGSCATSSPGQCTLRAAIQEANGLAGADTINFSIPAASDPGCNPGTGVCSIAPASPLPVVTSPVVVDGYTQSGASVNTNAPPLGLNTTLKVELNGAGAGPAVDGIEVIAGGSTIRGLVINRFTGRGIFLRTAGGNMVEGNFVGTDVAGTVDLGVGVWGVHVYGVSGNVVGGTGAAARNLISGNHLGTGIEGVGATGNYVQGNLIGTRIDGSGSLGQTLHGVVVQVGASNNAVGGSTPAAANTIAHSGGHGVAVFGGGTGNSIRGNSIFSNSGSGIDLYGDGVTPNDTGDTDTGENNLQNFPVLALATSGGGSTLVEGTFNSNASGSFELEFFHSIACDGPGYGEGASFLGTASVATDGSGDASPSPFVASFAGTVPAGEYITATATNVTTGDTSEFSQCETVAPSTQFTVIKDFSDNSPADVSVTLGCTSGTVANDDTTASEADPANFTVYGFSPGTSCTATEAVPGGYTANETACASVAISTASASSCGIVNTVAATPTPTPSPTPPPTPSPTPPAGAACVPARPHPAGTSTESILSGSVTRQYFLQIPPSYNGFTAMPVVFLFHGRNWTLSQTSLLAYVTGFDTKANTEGFILVYPQGASGPGGTPWWNSSLAAGYPDDILLVNDVLNRLSSELCVDPARVFSTGISNGGLMSVRLACSLSSRIAAVAPVVGAYYPPVSTVFAATETCPDTRPVPLITFMGEDDTYVPFHGGTNSGGVPGWRDIEAAVMPDWARHNGCSTTPVMSTPFPGVRLAENPGCTAGATTMLYVVEDVDGPGPSTEGGGHQWPGSVVDLPTIPPAPPLGANTHLMSATNLMWDFFAAHPMSAAAPPPQTECSACTPTEQDSMSISQNGGTIPADPVSSSDLMDASVSIPAGALIGPTAITITELSATDPSLPPPPANSFPIAFEFGPPGTQFAQDVTIVLHYSVADLGGSAGTMQANLLVNGVYTPVLDCLSTNPPNPNPCVFARDSVAGTVTIKTRHFSTYALSVSPTVGGIMGLVDDSDALSPASDDPTQGSAEMALLAAGAAAGIWLAVVRWRRRATR